MRCAARRALQQQFQCQPNLPRSGRWSLVRRPASHIDPGAVREVSANADHAPLPCSNLRASANLRGFTHRAATHARLVGQGPFGGKSPGPRLGELALGDQITQLGGHRVATFQSYETRVISVHRFLRHRETSSIDSPGRAAGVAGVPSQVFLKIRVSLLGVFCEEP